MTNQLQGEMLFAGWSGSTAEDWVYTPWMPVRGDIGTFGVQILQRNNVTLTWNVETRASESATADPLFNSDQMAASVDTFVATNTGAQDIRAKEWVRYRFKTGGTANVTDYVGFRPLQPTWRVDRRQP
jgi:hypothetical protein